MNETGHKSLDTYVQFLNENDKEVKILGQDFLIGVTKFFRDKQSFELLGQRVLPDLIGRKTDKESLKVWVCACSTGQEAYSIAILINECLQKAKRNIELKIFATDIDEKSIEIAARNQYPLTVEKDVPAAYLKKYFVTDGKFYSLIPEIRKQVVFAKHDVTKAPPFIKNDLVTCRNMLIYMNTVLQGRVLSTFHFSLVKDGYLFLGSSETANVLKDGIEEISSKWKIYQKVRPINYAAFNTYSTGGRLLGQPEKTVAKTVDAPLGVLEKRFNKFITSDLGYVGVFVDKGYLIQEAVGNYRAFLSLPDQKLELNILKMVPKEISIVLNTALRKSWKDNIKVHLSRLRLIRDGHDVYLNVSIQPPEGEMIYTMIVFAESRSEIIPDKEDHIFSGLSGEQHSEYIYELEAELNETRSNLQLAVEEMETTNEELQSTNEELLSANEELQSSNEELQSLNEELHTLNTEHQVKIKELGDLNDDLDNYFRSTDIGQVFLDLGLFIRKFNPAAIRMVNLIDADIGRSIEHISNNILAEDLSGDIRSVLMSGHVLEKEVQLKNGNRSLMRIMPYLRKDNQKDGVVITFVDVTHIAELNNMISGVFNASLSGILAFTAVRNHEHFIVDFKCISYNNAALKLLHKSTEELDSALLVKQLPELTEGSLFQKYINLVEKGTTIETESQLADGQWFQLVAVKMSDGFAATLTNITEQKAAGMKLKKNYNELMLTRESLNQLNAELEQKVDQRTRELSDSEERFEQVSRATNDTIWDWSMVSNTMWRSENFTYMFGYPAGEDSNNIRFWFEKIHPEDRQRVQDSVYGAINNDEKQWSAEYRLLKADGDYAIILDRGTIMQDDLGTPFRMVGSMVDITRLIEAETKLTTSEKKFRKVFDSNLIGMSFFNVLTGVIKEANEAFLSMIGYAEEDLENDALDWKRLTPPEYIKIANSSLKQLKEDGVCSPYEQEFFRKDGKKISVMVGSALLDEENSNEAVTYIINITAQKRGEEKRDQLQQLVKKQQDEFRNIFKMAPALITIRRGKELLYEFANDAFIDFYGVRDYIGQSSARLDQPEVDPKITEIEQHVLQTGETYVAKSFLIQRMNPVTKDMDDYWFDFILTPVYSDLGEIDGIAFFGFEVTDLLRAQQATKELMQRKDEFLSIASHELKTPITSIQGFLQLALRLAEKENADKRMLSFIGKANRQLGNLTSLVSDLLDVTKIQAGQMQFNYGTFNIKGLIEQCVGDIISTEHHEILIADIDDVEIYGDQHRVEQVINNFLSNAIKYSPDTKTATIYTEIIDKQLKVSVKDYGIGIPTDKIDHVFDRFVRVHDTSMLFSGLGLGLYISAEIVRRHNGTIGVNSKENEGSEFWFKLPLR